MSNTGYKGICASFDEEGEVSRYQVVSQWNGDRRRANLTGATLKEALTVRRKFEQELDKPPTERHIRGGTVGSVYPSTTGPGSAIYVAQLGDTRRCFAVRKYGKSEAKALAEAALIELLESEDSALAAWHRRHSGTGR